MHAMLGLMLGPSSKHVPPVFLYQLCFPDGQRDMLFDSVSQSLGSSAYIPSIRSALERINNIGMFWGRQNILLNCRNQTSRCENHSWTNSKVHVWDTSFDFFLISLRHFPFPRNLDGDGHFSGPIFRSSIAVRNLCKNLLMIYLGYPFSLRMPAMLSISVWSLELDHILFAWLTNTSIKPILYHVELKESHHVYWLGKVGFL